MSSRIVLFASVSAAFLAACVAESGPAAAASQNPNALLAASAYRALASGDPATAVSTYSQAIESRELEPEILANALLNRAFAYQYLDQHELAVDDYSAALRIDAMSAKLRAMALYNRGLSYQKLRKSGAAIEDFTSALFLDGGFAHAYYRRANLLRESGQFLFALSDYEKAIQFKHPDPARVYYGEALTYDALQRPQNARDAMAKALAANPKFEPAKTRLAGSSTVPKALSVADPMATATIGGNSGGVAARKAELPKPAVPTAALLGSNEGLAPVAAVQKKKLIIDRVPMEQAEAQPAAEAEADGSTLAEKVVAIEPVDATKAPAAPDPKPATAKQASAEDPATAPDTANPANSDWSVQIASAVSEDAAWSTWKKMQAKHRILSGKKPVVVRADLGTKGTFYRVRLTGFENQGDAKSACTKLKSGGVNCFISKASS